MKKTILVLAILIATAAHATPGGEGNNTGCNGVGNANSPCAGSPGNGGQGGAGGSATSTSRAEARAKAAAIAAQRQSLTSTINNTVNAAPVNVKVNVTAPPAAPVGEAKPAAPTEQPIKQAAATEKSDPLIVAPAQDRNPVNTAYSAPLTATNGTCMGSTSGGVQVASLGLSGASTWTDANCDIRYDAEALRAAGLAKAAIARLCQKGDIEKAMAAAGTPCPSSRAGEAARAAAILNDESVPTRQAVAGAVPALLP
jgi:hypothetical protein